ncbi:MAG: CDP-diacylglycerol--glycerol-3-phosphate 3-phosphatidyltransferase [Ruminococcus sp.]|nr:CDP-diacylglycerol--glycerol-3-phosphate 3-phosphatidyltransferase [Candidatus Copronaster equi]
MNLPNKITVFRMFIAPIFLAVFLLNLPHSNLFAAIIFIIGAITDAIDGNLARKNNMVTNFGKLLDPIADKMLVTACMLGFLKFNICNIWIVMIILTREFAVTSLRLIASAQGVVIPANIFGKIKTVAQMISSIAVLILCEINTDFSLGLNISLISNILMAVTAVFAVVSGIIYFIKGFNLIDIKK